MLPFLKQKPKRKKKSIAISGHAFDYAGSANTIEYWDGDVSCNSSRWDGIKVPTQISFFNSPTYNAAGLNGHGTIQFNGTNQYGSTATPVINQPNTIYVVLKQITWAAFDIIFDDGITGGTQLYLSQEDNSPEINYFNVKSNQLLINNWGIITLIANGNQSFLKVNLNSSIKTNIIQNRQGLFLAASPGPGFYTNIEVAYIILRDVADNVGIQSSIIQQLKNRFAI